MKMNIAIKIISTAGLALGLSAGALNAQTNMVINGSFETAGGGVGTFPGWNNLGPADNNSDYGVAQSTVSPDVAEQGSYYAYFHGHPTDGSQDCLGQSLTLIVGQQYNITYYMGTDGTTLGSGAAMWVVIGNSFGIDYSQDVSLTAFFPNSASALPYQKYSTIFTPTNANPILSFHGVDATSSILVDNVSVTLVVPQLNVTVSPTNSLVFWWTATTNAYLIQTNTSLHTNNWVTLTNKPVTVGITNQIVLLPPKTNVFYRLLWP